MFPGHSQRAEPTSLEVELSKTDTNKYVVPEGHDLPEAFKQTQPEVARYSYPEDIDSTPPEALPTPVSDSKEVFEPPKERTVCGLRRKTFFVVLATILLIIVIGAAVGGGVGGSLANK